MNTEKVLFNSYITLSRNSKIENLFQDSELSGFCPSFRVF